MGSVVTAGAIRRRFTYPQQSTSSRQRGTELTQPWGCGRFTPMPPSRLTEKRNETVRRLRRLGWSLSDIGKRFHVSRQYIQQILHPPKRATRGSVYVARAGRYVKIGVTYDTLRRIRALDSSSPLPVSLLFTLPGGRQLERALHRYFSSSRRRNEWYRLTPQIRAFIRIRRFPMDLSQ